MKNKIKNSMFLLMGMIFMGGSAYGGIGVITASVGDAVSDEDYVMTYLGQGVLSTAMETSAGEKAYQALVEFSETQAGKNAMETQAGKNTINAFLQLLATPTTSSITQESLFQAIGSNIETEDSVDSEVSDVAAVVENRPFGLLG